MILVRTCPTRWGWTHYFTLQCQGLYRYPGIALVHCTFFFFKWLQTWHVSFLCSFDITLHYVCRLALCSWTLDDTSFLAVSVHFLFKSSNELRYCFLFRLCMLLLLFKWCADISMMSSSWLLSLFIDTRTLESFPPLLGSTDGLPLLRCNFINSSWKNLESRRKRED